jgi:large subunit ribosomal protein L43
MNAATGEWQLKTLRIQYSETAGSSLGVRFYKSNLLQDWKSINPHVEVILVHSQYQHPNVTAIYNNGEEAKCNLRNLTARQIDDLLNLYRNSSGNNLHLRHGGPRCWTERRSIQGIWQPSLECALKQLKWFHRGSTNTPTSLKYSETSLALARQHLEGKGRWGDQLKSPKGFDRHLLTPTFSNPFVTEGVKLLKRLVK